MTALVNSPGPACGDRVALFLPNMSGGGAERVALALLEGLVERGHAVDLVLVNREGVLLPLVPLGVEIVDLGVTRLRQALLPLARYLRERRPQAMHAMMWPLPMLAVAARAIARVGTRIVGSEHTTLSIMPMGLQSRPVRAVTRRAYLKLDAIIAVSAGVADDLATLIDIPRDRMTVIYNPLTLPATLPDPAVMADRWPIGTKRILAVGTLKDQKNYPLLLKALARVRRRVSASLVVVGEGGLLAKLERQVAADGLKGAVCFAGFDTDPWPYYAAADLFVLSSDYEGFGNVLVEALHAGLPVVSTDCPNGPREILQDGTFGALVPCNDVAALADAIEAMLQGPRHDRSRIARAETLSGEDVVGQHIALMLNDGQ